MAGGSRRYHQKSRNGCGHCKRKHIKVCVERPPQMSSILKGKPNKPTGDFIN